MRAATSAVRGTCCSWRTKAVRVMEQETNRVDLRNRPRPIDVNGLTAIRLWPVCFSMKSS